MESTDPQKEVLELIAANVRKLRKQLDISQEELGFRAGMHRTHVGLVERAKINLSATNIKKLALALNVPVAKLFEGEVL